MAELQIDERIVWAFVDMETTGLSAQNDVPLELGIKLTDVEGFVIAEESWLVWENKLHWEERLNAARKHHIVGPMHEKSGLFEDIDSIRDLIDGHPNEAETYTRAWVDADIVRWLQDCGAPVYRERTDEDPGYDGLGMTGNSIGSLDRPFALVHFPLLNEFLGYRNIDMSSFKEMCKRTNSELFAQLKPIIGDKSMADHRTLGDIDACINEYRAYLENFVFTGSEVV